MAGGLPMIPPGAGGGMPGMPGAPAGGAPAGGAPGGIPGAAQPNPLAAIAQLAGRFAGQQTQNDPAAIADGIDQIMMMVGKWMQRAMTANPKAYQSLLKAQMNLHTAKNEAKTSAQSAPSPIQSSVAQMMQPGAPKPPGVM